MENLVCGLAMVMIAGAAAANLQGGGLCGSDEAMEHFFSAFPEARKEHLANKEQLRAGRHRLQGDDVRVDKSPAGQPAFIIPVVFHVYGSGFSGKPVTDAIVVDALLKTNEDFQGRSEDFHSVIPEFAGVRDSLDIEFRLAAIGPGGEVTSGIVYHEHADGFGDALARNPEIRQHSWDNYKYLNVHIQDDVFGRGNYDLSGVAWPPSSFMSDERLARVVYNGAYLGSNASENDRSILTHELGHWLGLLHTFHGGCQPEYESMCTVAGDGICDTPQVSRANLQGDNCLGEVTNWQNFMNYSDQYANFTREQVERLSQALEHPARKTLWASENLQATGTVELEVPGQPVRVDASDGLFEEYVRVKWAPVAGARVYRIFRCPEGAVDCGAPIGLTSDADFQDISSEPGKQEDYRIQACTTAGCGGVSAADPGHRGLLEERTASPVHAVQPVPAISRWAVMLLLFLIFAATGLASRSRG